MISTSGVDLSEVLAYFKDPDSWQHQAACAMHDPLIFEVADQDTHPDWRTKDLVDLNHLNRTKAIAVCATCPVKAQCLEEALPLDRAHTVRGGLIPEKGLTGPGRPVTDVDDSDPELTLDGLRQSHLDMVMRLWLQGAELQDADRVVGYVGKVSKTRPWRRARQELMARPANCTVKGIRSIALARSASGHVYSVLRKNSESRQVSRSFHPSSEVELDAACGMLPPLLQWPKWIDG